MATQDRIIELVDDTGMQLSTSVTGELTTKAGIDDLLENVSPKSDRQPSYESGSLLDYEIEDVPSDFFDDFSNQDFMAGLDVVDAWDDEEMTDDKEKLKKADDTPSKSRYKDKTRRRRSRSPLRSNYRYRNYDRRRPSPRDRNRRRSVEKSKDKVKEIKADKETKNDGDVEESADHRRDPEKTKRDIQKDKDKWTKNNEAKIVSEKLKVVETGLVPPGTEMEVDLKQLKSAGILKTTDVVKPAGVVKEPERKPSNLNHRPDRRRRSRSSSANAFHNRVAYRERRYSPRRGSRSHERSYDHNRFLYRHSRSPYRGRSRSRSPRKISPERRTFIEERKRMRRLRDSSPTVLRKKSKDLDLSPVSNVSEREMWLRQRDRKYVRNISYSPVSDTDSGKPRKNVDFLEELATKLKSDKKKRSFLKEIHERLNEPSKSNFSGRCPPPGLVPSSIPGPNSIPAMPGHPPPGFMPMGHPDFYQPHMDPTPQYDQQFFIGHADMFHNPNPYQQPYLGHMPDPMSGELFNGPPSASTVIIPHAIDSPITYNVNLLEMQRATEMQKEKDKEAVAKLFEDKKISLSDFLSMSAKHTDPTKPVNVQRKIKVISLCQDAIKALGGDSKLSGRFFLKKTAREVEKSSEAKFQSPLRKIPVVRFNFTTLSKTGDDKSSLQSTLSKLLASLGLAESPPAVVPKPSPSPVPSEASVKSVSVKHQQQQTITSIKRKYDPIVGARFQMKMCQTDPTSCHICDIRKSRKFVDQSVQCEISTVDSETQITDEDVRRLGMKTTPVKNVLRNQSLAYLTPAQLLAGTTDEEESPKPDIFPAARMLTPPPPDISPEKQNFRNSLSNNDSFPNRSEYPDRFKPDPFSNQTKPNRAGAHQLPSIFDMVVPNPYNKNKVPSNSFEPAQSNNYGGNSNKRQFVPPKGKGKGQGRGKFKPGPYGGRNFY